MLIFVASAAAAAVVVVFSAAANVVVAVVVVIVAAALTYVKILNLCSGKNEMSAKTATTATITHTCSTCVGGEAASVCGRAAGGRVAFQLSGQSAVQAHRDEHEHAKQPCAEAEARTGTNQCGTHA